MTIIVMREFFFSEKSIRHKFPSEKFSKWSFVRLRELLAKEQIAKPHLLSMTRSNGRRAIAAQTTYSLRGVVKEGKVTAAC